MRTGEPEPRPNVHYLHDRAPVRSDARAYGGLAHGQEWAVDPVEPPPWVELPTGFSSSLYRLARHPRTGRPARDYLGNLLYVPLGDVGPPRGTRERARILAFPGNSPTGRRSQRAAQDTPQEASALTLSTGAADTGQALGEGVIG